MVLNPFRLLEIDPQWNLDAEVLDQQYFKKQRAFHPDRVTDPLQKIAMAEHATACNVAYIQLKSSLQRAQAILEYYAYPVEHEKPDPLFLMDFFQWQENHATDPTVLQDKKREVWNHLNEAFQTHDLKQAAYYTGQWQYLEKY